MKARVILPLLLVAGLACVKRPEPPAPEKPAATEIEQALAQTQQDLEKLRMSRQASAELLSQAEESLKQARALAQAGQGEKAYAQVLAAQKQIQAAKAAAALAGSKDSPEEAGKKIETLKQKAAEPAPDLGVKISRAEAERAIGEISKRLDKAKEEQKELDTQVDRAEHMLEQARSALSEGSFEKAYNTAKRAGNYLEEVLDAVRKAAKKSGSSVLFDSWVVKKGDNLWDIAQDPRVYGDPLLWPFIFKANQDKIKDPNLILVGWTLKIPRGRVSRDKLKSLKSGAAEEEPSESDDQTLPDGEVLLETEGGRNATATPKPTAPPVPPTATAIPPSPTRTPVPATPVPQAAATPVPPTSTPVPPTSTATVVPPAATAVPTTQATAAPTFSIPPLPKVTAIPAPAAPSTSTGGSAGQSATKAATAAPTAAPATTDPGLDDLLKDLELPSADPKGNTTAPAALELPEL